MNFAGTASGETSSTSRSTPRRPRRSRAPSSQQLPRSRDLDWDGLLNARDLGGHPTEDGAETRWGSIVRTDSVRQLTDAGWQRSSTTASARSSTCARTNSRRILPAELPVEAVHVSFFDSVRRSSRRSSRRARPPPTTPRRRARSTSSSWSTSGRTSPPRSGRLRTHPRRRRRPLPRRQGPHGTRQRVPPAPRRRSDRGDRDRLLAQRGGSGRGTRNGSRRLPTRPSSSASTGSRRRPLPPWCRCSRSSSGDTAASPAT